MMKRREQLCVFNGAKYLCVRHGAERPEITGATYLEMRSDRGLSFEWPVVYGRVTSGYAALNLAVLLGAKRIALLGFDYNEGGGHWFGEYDWNGWGCGRWTTWAKEFDYTIEPLEDHGIEVANFNLDSRVTAYPKFPLTELPEWYD